jgi:hypothetical protein
MPKSALKKSESKDLVLIPRDILLPKPQFDDFRYIVIPTEQIRRAAEAFSELARTYARIAEGLEESVKRIIEVRTRVAEQLSQMFDNLAVFESIDLLVQIPSKQSLTDGSSSTRIFIQPNQTITPTKELPPSKRKQMYPISFLKRKELGFVFQDEYIKGIKAGSQPGRVLEVFISPELKGKVPDKLLYKAAGIEYGDYYNLGVVLRDMQRILLNENKIELNKKRESAIKRYILSGITKRIRKPKKSKKSGKTTKTN